MTQTGGRKLEKRMTNKKKEKAQKVNEFVTEYLSLCKRTGHMMFATLKNADAEGTQFAIQYKVRQYRDDQVNVPDSVRLQDELIELEQTGKIEKGSDDHKAKVAAIDEARAKELQSVLDSLPTTYADDEEREIKYETAIKLQDILIMSKDKEEALSAVLKYVKSLYGGEQVEVVAQEIKKDTTTEEAKTSDATA
jgi:hypothetical protein